MNSDGTGITRLIEPPAGLNPTLRRRKDQPSWSTDYTQVAFISHASGEGGIYVVNVDGTNLRLVFDEPDLLPGIGNPAWSPDGTRLAFAANRDIYVLDLTSGAYRNLTNSPEADEHPSWSPDGTHIVFASSRGSGGIFIMASDGTDPRWLAPGGGPDWSPDGSQIAYVYNGDVYTVNIDGTHQSQLTVSPGRDISPSWSPEGEMIAFDSERDGNEEIYIMQADGSGQARLTENPSYDVNPAW